MRNIPIKEKTIVELFQDHVELWEWLAENPGKFKHDFFACCGLSTFDSLYRPLKECFLCEIALRREHKESHHGFIPKYECSYCPLVGLWGGHVESGIYLCANTGSVSIYDKWEAGISKKNNSYYAQLIADRGREQMIIEQAKNLDTEVG